LGRTVLQGKYIQSLYHVIGRLRDLWILLAWIGIITAIMLNNFYNRNCFDFMEGNLTNPCQTEVDWIFFFMAAVGAGATLSSEAIKVLGFLIVHTSATIIFIAALILPYLIGATDTTLFSTVFSETLTVSLASQFPVPLFLSLIGSLFGFYFGGKLGDWGPAE
jgi:hypothetical protein